MKQFIKDFLTILKWAILPGSLQYDLGLWPKEDKAEEKKEGAQ